MHRRTTVLMCVFAILLVSAAFLLWANQRMHPGVLMLSFLDIGQGDAVLIEAPNGNQVLYDAGPNVRVLRALGKRMPFFDRSLDVVMMSHPDLDHIGGFPDVLSRMSVRVLLDPEYKGRVKNAAYSEARAIVTREHIPVVVARAGTRVVLDDGVFIDVLYPAGGIETGDTNIASTVIKLSYGSTSALLSGDLPSEVEGHLVKRYGSMLDVDVFKAAHHGSKTANSEVFLRALSPGVVIISAGKENTYGHPHQEVVDRLAKKNIRHLGTYESGTIALTSNGSDWRVDTEYKK